MSGDIPPGTEAAGAGGGSEAAYKSTIEFFITWIRRIGMMVAFVGAIMFALAIKNNESDSKQNALLTMIAGFVAAAVAAAFSVEGAGAPEQAWIAAKIRQPTNSEAIFTSIFFINRQYS